MLPYPMNQKFEAIVSGIIADNYATCEDFFDAKLVTALRNNLIGRKANHQMHQAGIGRKASSQQNLQVRGDEISWLEDDTIDPAERAFFDTIEAFYRYLNHTCYTGINGSEFHYALYEPGSFYKRHLDRFQHDSGRQISVITYLNDDWVDADGGELVLYLESGEQIIRLKPGRVVFFKADEIEHEVKVAHRGRMSIAGWLLRV
jgi:SM-20-related protein